MNDLVLLNDSTFLCYHVNLFIGNAMLTSVSLVIYSSIMGAISSLALLSLSMLQISTEVSENTSKALFVFIKILTMMISDCCQSVVKLFALVKSSAVYKLV